MKRPAPARLRELRLTPPTEQPKSIFSRVPLLQSSSDDWASGDHIPGLLIPIAFLSSLRANLQISTCDELYSPSPFSVVNTPTNPFYAPLPVSETKGFNAPTAEVTSTPTPTEPVQWGNERDTLLQIDEKPSPDPSISTYFTKSDEDLGDALHLISDSVREQRQMAIRSILFHPYIMAVSILIFLTSSKILYTGSSSDLVLVLCAWVGYSMTGLFTVRRMVREYNYIAARVGAWFWLSESSISGVSHRRDEVLVAKSGDEIVGVLVLRMARITGAGTPGFSYGTRSRRKSSARWTGIIRAWTVKESDRMQGIGRRLLSEAVSNCRLRSLDGPIFADDHANATKVLPRLFNSAFEKHERWAKNILQETIIEQRGH